jgi:excisionase family DNA binding protein
MEYLTVKELATYIRRTPGACRNLVLRRAIPYRKPAGRLLFDKDEIDQWIEKSPGISLEELKEGEI